VVLEAGSLEPVADVVLEAAPAARPRPAGGLVLIELKTGRLASYDIASKLAKKWDVPLDDSSLTGDPLAIDGQLLVALADGHVIWLDAATGQIARKVDLGQQLAFGPQKWGDIIVVGTLDGTLVIVNGAEDVAP
jgi:outer membrane protein assembly factor BamB